jgi:hypothetical protein
MYDVATNLWTVLQPMATARVSPTLTGLADGRVLVAGGYGPGGVLLASAEIFDMLTGTWSPTQGMTTARALHSASLLPGGKVLVAGGGIDPIALDSAELFDPIAGTWTPTGRMQAPRNGHTATVIAGMVLVAGGSDGNPHVPGSGSLASAELFVPMSGTWVSAGSMSAPRYHLAASLIGTRVLVSGGLTFNYLSSAEEFSIASTPADICALTTEFIESSAKYQALSPSQKLYAAQLATGLCAKVAAIAPTLTSAQKAAATAAYQKAIDFLVSSGWLTSAQGAILKTSAAAL